MALDPLSIVKQIWAFGLGIMAALQKAGHNADDCDRIRELLHRLDAIAKHLQATPEALGDALMSDAAAGLDDALRRASELVAKCDRKGFLRRAWEAKDIADKLHKLCLDVLLNLIVVLLANGIHTTSMVAEIKETVAQLRADAAYNNSMLAKLLQIVSAPARPDGHLQKEVAQLLQDYQKSTEYATSQNGNKRETKKSDVGRKKVKIQKNNRPGDSKAAPHASLSDGLAESASVKSVTRKCGSSTIINKIISRSIKNTTSVTSIDAHPTKTWIVTGHEGGNFSIWNYQKQKTMMELQVNKVPGKAARWRHGISQYIKETAAPHWVCSVKFIAQGNLLAVGDGYGYIRIYAYNGTELCELKKFRAHHSSVDSLTIHPTKQYLLSSSIFGRKIKHWDWSSNWLKIQEFDVKPTIEDGVRSVKFNPSDTNTFACVTYDNRVKVGNIKSSDLTTRLRGPFKAADYFFTHSHQHLMVTLRFKSPNAEIRDLETGEVVHTLGVSGRKTIHVAFLPTLLKLVTTLDDGTVCLWDASTYRLEEMVHITDSKPHDLVFVTDTNGLTRFVVTFETSIAIMEVKLPIANRSKQTGSGNYG